MAFAALLLGFGPARAHAITNSHVEVFNSTTFKDAVNTTADWNTAAGKLKLAPFQPTLLGSYATPGIAASVVVSGTVAYVADNASGLQILNISNPASPTLLGSYNTPDLAQAVAVSGTVAYVADVESGLQIINVSNPASPTLLGSYNTPNSARGVAVSGTLAYVAGQSSGIQIINVSNPASPTLIGSYDTPGDAWGIAVSGTVAYVADGLSGLQILDASNPASPTLIATYDTPGYATSVVVSGTVAYVADDAWGLRILNVSNPASPTLLGSYDTPGQASGVVVSGTVAYVADRGSGLQILDVSNPAIPTLIGSYDTPASAVGVAVSGTVACVADFGSGLHIIKVGDQVSPTSLGNYASTSFAYGVAVSGGVTYLTDGLAGLRILNTSNPTSPTLLATHDTPGFVYDVAVEGSVACLADGASGLRILNVANPSSPSLLGTYVTDAVSVAISGPRAFVTDRVSSLKIINISNPASPTLLASYVTPGAANGVAVSGTVAYVADGGAGLLLLDVSNPATPSLLGSYDTPGFAYHVAVSGSVAFVADNATGLLAISVSNPVSPTLISTYDTPDIARGVSISGAVAYVADGSSGLQILNVSNPASPSLIGSCNTPGSANRVVVSGAQAYVADLNSGLQIIEVAQNRFDLSRDVGWSLANNATNDVITRARLTSTQVNNVTWQLSTLGGYLAQTIIPGSGWVELTPGSDLRWIATLSAVPPYLTANPGATRVEVEWLYPFPVLSAIADLPNDQGRQVRLDWTRSDHDFVGSSPQITEYAIYRRIDPGFAPLTRNVRERVEATRSREDAEALAAGWDFVTSVPSSAEDEYSVLVPTLADSSIAAGQHWTAFKVRARTATPGVFYESYPDSGYSKDNLSPATPAPFAGVFNGGPARLHWGASHDADFDHYALHRGGASNFVPGPGNLVASQPDTGFVDNGSTWAYYKLAAVDVSGNASGYALVTPASTFTGNTSTGNNITVSPSPIVQLTYQHVTGGGQTQLTMQTGGTVPPNGLKVAPGSPPLYYVLSSTATFTGTVTVCITYDPDFLSGQEKNLKLMHYDTALIPPSWVQVQTSRDTAANEICGTVTHFSEFALMELDETVVGVEERDPSAFQLVSCAPNPVTGPARILYDLPVASAVRLGLFDLQGRLVRELERHPTVEAGRHTVEWDGRGAHGERLQAGVYFLWLDTGGARQMRRVAVTR